MWCVTEMPKTSQEFLLIAETLVEAHLEEKKTFYFQPVCLSICLLLDNCPKKHTINIFDRYVSEVGVIRCIVLENLA